MNIAYQAATVLGVGEHSASFTTDGLHPRPPPTRKATRLCLSGGLKKEVAQLEKLTSPSSTQRR
jgi:hypothetical protein